MTLRWERRGALTVLFVTLLAAASLYVFYVSDRRTMGQSTADDSTRVITLTPKGFTPQFLEVRVGDTVTFRTVDNRPFWPASNLHPEHGIYPDFDPGHPLQPGEEWAFQFTRVGDWGFHDHVRSYFIGTVRVLE